MALPIADATLKELDKEVRDFFWTKQCEGETMHKRRRVARPRIAADLHMGGLNVPTFQTLAEGFRLNLLQRIYKRELFPHKYSLEKNQVPREVALTAISLACLLV